MQCLQPRRHFNAVLTNRTAWHDQGYLQSPEYLKINPCGTCVPHRHTMSTAPHACTLLLPMRTAQICLHHVAPAACRVPVLTDHEAITINESCGILLYILRLFGASLLRSPLRRGKLKPAAAVLVSLAPQCFSGLPHCAAPP
jgi:hypothetical protein